MPIKVLLADDHKIIRQGMKAMLQSQHDILVVGEASDGNEALNMTQSLEPDIILLDIMMPNLNGIEVAHQLSRGDHEHELSSYRCTPMPVMQSELCTMVPWDM